MRIVFMEAAVVSGLAGIFGYLLGWGATKAAVAVFAGSHSGAVAFNWQLGAAALVIALGVGMLSSIYPANVAARLDPSEALRAL